jgi:hypothetical protein
MKIVGFICNNFLELPLKKLFYSYMSLLRLSLYLYIKMIWEILNTKLLMA